MQAEAPRVSAIIPTYNYARYAAAAVESVLSQSFRDLEIVVVDDGSTDETTETLRPFGTRIRYIRQAHRGLAAARNMGIRASRGRYLAFLDSDDLWLPDKISMQIARLDPDPAVGLVYCEAALFNEESAAEFYIAIGRIIRLGESYRLCYVTTSSHRQRLWCGGNCSTKSDCSTRT